MPGHPSATGSTSTMSNAKFASLIGSVATHYWGAPNQVQSRPGHPRWGNKGSRSVNLHKGAWYDHERTAGGGVVDLIRLEEGDSVDLAAALEKFGLPKGEEQPRRVEIDYPYVDEHGEVIYFARRIEIWKPGKVEPDKTFRQHRGVGPDGRILWGMTGVTALPYCLPDLIAHPSKTVFIAEGEKCVEAIRSLGLLATTNHGGAGKWWPSLDPWFAGRKCIIVPDHDEAGQRHVHQVAAHLKEVGASVRVLDYPSPHPKYDIYNWIDEGGTKEQFLAMAAAARPYDTLEPPSDFDTPIEPEVKPNPIRIYSYDEMAQMPPVEWQVDKVLPARAKTVLFGVSNAFKSFLAVDLACCVATGTDWHGNHARQGNVLYIATEGAFGVGRKRIPAWMAKHKVPAELRRNIRMIAGDVVIKGEMDDLLYAIAEAFSGPVALVVVDVLAGTMDGSESDDEAAREWVNAATRLVMHLQAAMLVVTHSPYSDDARMRGHSHIWGSFDTRLKAEGDKEAKTTTLSVNRHKDHDSLGEWSFKLEEHPTDEHPLETSLVPLLNPDAPASDAKPTKDRMGDNARITLNAIAAAVDDKGRVGVVADMPPNLRMVSETTARIFIDGALPHGDLKRKNEAADRSLAWLISHRRIGKSGTWLWVMDAR